MALLPGQMQPLRILVPPDCVTDGHTLLQAGHASDKLCVCTPGIAFPPCLDSPQFPPQLPHIRAFGRDRARGCCVMLLAEVTELLQAINHSRPLDLGPSLRPAGCPWVPVGTIEDIIGLAVDAEDSTTAEVPLCPAGFRSYLTRVWRSP